MAIRSLPTGAGLSPRVRGKLLRRRIFRNPPRSIPACAGETRPLPRNPSAGWVYPRVCGGNDCRGCRLIRQHGLSPRVQGKP